MLYTLLAKHFLIRNLTVDRNFIKCKQQPKEEGQKFRTDAWPSQHRINIEVTLILWASGYLPESNLITINRAK
jgi:hypothetical protein